MDKKIWLTSDLHFGHNKDFIYKARGFSSIEEHDEAIIQKWNEMVDYDDLVFLLGDLMLGDKDNGIKCLSRLKGDIKIILGNHDTANKIELYTKLPNTRTIGHGIPFKYKKYHFYLSHYPTYTGNLDDNKNLRKAVINLYGHTHQKDSNFFNDNFQMYHVGLDSHNLHPVLLTDIIEEIKTKL